LKSKIVGLRIFDDWHGSPETLIIHLIFELKLVAEIRVIIILLIFIIVSLTAHYGLVVAEAPDERSVSLSALILAKIV
jgi:hypothetical protein